jgi:hypothetical protein
MRFASLIVAVTLLAATAASAGSLGEFPWQLGGIHMPPPQR